MSFDKINFISREGGKTICFEPAESAEMRREELCSAVSAGEYKKVA